MNKHSARLAAIIACAASWAAQAHVAAQDLRARVSREAPAAWQKIIDLGRHLELKIADQRLWSTGEKEGGRWHVKVAGDSALVVSTDVDGKGAPGKEMVLCGNRSYAFHLDRPSPGAEWFMKFVGDEPDVNLRDFGMGYFVTPQLYVGPTFLPAVFGIWY